MYDYLVDGFDRDDGLFGGDGWTFDELDPETCFLGAEGARHPQDDFDAVSPFVEAVLPDGFASSVARGREETGRSDACARPLCHALEA